MENLPRVLLVMTTPYSVSDSSRTLDAYFHYWDKDKIRQIFSRNWIPNKGHCGEMYQITDSELLNKWLRKSNTVGKKYTFNEMKDSDRNVILDNGKSMGFFYALGSKHLPIIELLRGLLWRKKYWCTDSLVKWLDDYKPDCVLCNFSNHLFMQQIALFAAKRYRIPIVLIIGDDYFFNDKCSYSPFYWIFRYYFKKYTIKLAKCNASAIYCSDKIKRKYNEYFNLNGETIYITSTLKRKNFTPINVNKPKIVYFGSIRLGRNNALEDIADAISEINPEYMLEVYTSENDETYYKNLKSHKNIIYGGSIPYSVVKSKIKESDVFVIAEGFDEENINMTRYSLSTKAADGLASGVSILTYGPCESGVVEYMKDTGAAVVCTDKNKLTEYIQNLFFDIELQKRLYERAIIVFNSNHTFESSTSTFLKILNKAIIDSK